MMRGWGGGVRRPIQTEITADGFLSWVRTQFDASAKGQAWLNFFEDANQRIGVFLRNAVIWNYPGGMVGFYQAQGVIPATPIATGSVVGAGRLRLYALEDPNNFIDKLANTPGALPSVVEVFGWFPAPPNSISTANGISDGSPRWLLVSDTQNRLLWVASNSINVGTTDVELHPATNVALLQPDRPYAATDILTILGVEG